MPETGRSFTRSRAVRAASGVASFGVVIGFSLFAASPASAATVADCLPANTVDATTGTSADIQTLLDAGTPVICLSGTFTLTAGLTYDYDATLYGLSSAVLDGDGLYTILQDLDYADTLTVENLRLTNGSGNNGGAIDGYGVVVHNSTFDHNDATFGGAISADTLEITDSVFEQNTAAVGGAVAASQVTAARSTFTSNDSDTSGGAIFGSEVNVDASTFEGNTAFFLGGAIAGYGTVTVENSTFVDNTGAPDTGAGGAVFAQGGSVTQSTFLGNTASSGQSLANAGAPIYLRGNIFAGSTTEAHLFDATATSLFDDSGNLFTTSQATESALGSVQPSTQFGLTTLAIFDGATLADNGGPTRTVALYAGSPAIGAVPAGSLSVDQRGVTRPAVSDAGAYEFVEPVLAATGSAPSGWLAGAGALLLAGGALVLGLARRVVRAR